MKSCSKCKGNKELTEFTKDASRPDGLDRHCRECKTAAKRAYLAQGNNAELKSQRYKEWYQANREILLQKKREKRKDPVEKAKDKAIRAKWIEAMGREAYSAWRKRTKNKDKVKEYNKEYTARLPDAYVLRDINQSSKVRFTLEDIPKDLIEARRLLTLIRRASMQKENMA